MEKMFRIAICVAGFGLSPAHASLINIDLSGATSGTLINGIGADFAQTFAGQTVSGTGVTGSPTNPLTLQGSGNIIVAFFAPGVSAASNSLLSQPNNSAPLSILLDSDADTFSWTMGFANTGSTIDAMLFDAVGQLINTVQVTMSSGYTNYSFSGLGTFRGITFANDNDSAGVRFQNMSYNSVSSNNAPEPASIALLGLGLAGLVASRRRATKS